MSGPDDFLARVAPFRCPALDRLARFAGEAERRGGQTIFRFPTLEDGEVCGNAPRFVIFEEPYRGEARGPFADVARIADGITVASDAAARSPTFFLAPLDRDGAIQDNGMFEEGFGFRTEVEEADDAKGRIVAPILWDCSDVIVVDDGLTNEHGEPALRRASHETARLDPPLAPHLPTLEVVGALVAGAIGGVHHSQIFAPATS